MQQHASSVHQVAESTWIFTTCNALHNVHHPCIILRYQTAQIHKYPCLIVGTTHSILIPQVNNKLSLEHLNTHIKA